MCNFIRIVEEEKNVGKVKDHCLLLECMYFCAMHKEQNNYLTVFRINKTDSFWGLTTMKNIQKRKYEK